MSIFRDISGKIEPAVLGPIVDIDSVLRSLDIDYMIMGAAARDMIFHTLLDIPIGRMTLDVDFSVQVAAWTDFDDVESKLVEQYGFRKDTQQAQRFHHRSGTPVDIVPFGDIEKPSGTIAWPPDGGIVMSTLGMKDAMDDAIIMRIQSDPVLDVRVCSPAGLAILKTMAWSDRRQRGETRDALDLYFLMKHFLEAKEIHPPLVEDDVWGEDLTYEEVSSRLLGRNIGLIVTDHTRHRVEEILTAQVDENASLRLVTDMVREKLMFGDDRIVQTTLNQLRQLLEGIHEISTKVGA